MDRAAVQRELGERLIELLDLLAGDAVYAIRVFDASGEELSRSILSSMIGGYCTDGTVAASYDAMAETPDALSVQLFRLAEDGSEPVVERITLNLKK